MQLRSSSSLLQSTHRWQNTVVVLCALLIRLFESHSSAAETNAVRQISSGLYEIGLVRVDAQKRRLTLPAQINMVEGPIEYVLVSAMGKLHESILKTDAQPIHIHTAALLLLKEPPTTNAPPKVQVFVELPDGRIVPADSLIVDATTKKPLPKDDWRYLGSRSVDGTFIAQRDGSILAIMADPDTLMQTGRIAADDMNGGVPPRMICPPPARRLK